MAPDQAEALSLQAQVHSAADDPNADNNGTTVSTAVTALADLALSVSAAPEPAQAGGDILYTILVTNTGPSRAADVVVRDALPWQLQVQSASTSQGACTTDTHEVVCHLGNLAAGQGVAIAIRAGIPFLLGDVQVRNMAVVTTPTQDNAPENNEDAVVTLVQVGHLFRAFLPVMLK